MSNLYRYGSSRFGTQPYGGLSPAQVIPTRPVSGIIFLTSNDRYQIVSCSYGGTLDAPPEFRYWYANPPAWGENLNNDQYLPDFYSADENGDIPAGTLELSFRTLKSPQEMLVKGVTVEFIPRPSALTNESLNDTDTVGFSAHVEGQGVPEYTRAASGGTSGMIVSTTETFSELANDQSSSVWPNVRTASLPCRILQRVSAARVILTNIQLCEIVSVQLIGDVNIPARDR